MACLFGHLRFKSYSSGLNFCKYIDPSHGDEQPWCCLDNKLKLGRYSDKDRHRVRDWTVELWTVFYHRALDSILSYMCSFLVYFENIHIIRCLTCIFFYISIFLLQLNQWRISVFKFFFFMWLRWFLSLVINIWWLLIVIKN